MATYKSNFDKWDVGVAIGRTNPTPLDSTEVQSFANLTEYAKSGATSYVGQIVKTISNSAIDGCYIIKNANGDLIKLTTDDDLKKFGGVFQFQGVASAIDADHCTLTIGKATKKEQNTDGIEVTASFEVSDYKVDIEGDTYYHWTSSTAKVTANYWTRGDFVNGAKTYTKSESTANTFVYNEETYYQTGETVDTPSNRTKYLTLDGDVLWVDDSKYIYATSASETKVQADAVTLTFDTEVVFFTETGKLEKVTSSGSPEKAVDTSTKSNKGHVYQLGEEEYASNGTIWVQLGSPKEDWIVIK